VSGGQMFDRSCPADAVLFRRLPGTSLEVCETSGQGCPSEIVVDIPLSANLELPSQRPVCSSPLLAFVALKSSS
jgi:hypothetical protein